MPEAVITRSVVVQLDRAMHGEVERTEWRYIEADAAALADDLARAVKANAEALDSCQPEMPDGVYGRSREVWEPLLIIAEVLGGPAVAERAREACEAFRAEVLDDKAAGLSRRDPSESLLVDLGDVWTPAADFVTTADLLYRLHRLPDRAWGQVPELTPHRLARLLNRYGIKPDRLTDDNRTRGYYRAPIAAAQARYIGKRNP